MSGRGPPAGIQAAAKRASATTSDRDVGVSINSDAVNSQKTPSFKD
jgi:hypothetical protein